MGKVEAAALIVGIVMPLLVSVCKQWGFSKKVNTIIAMIVCALAGVLTAYATGEFTGGAIVTTIAVIMAAAMSTYQLYWRGTKLEATVNYRTSVKKQRNLLSKSGLMSSVPDV